MRDDGLKSWITGGAIALAALLPLLALLPFGWLWLWQNGFALYWLAGALAVSVLVVLFRTWLMRRYARALDEAKRCDGLGDAGLGATAPREKAAWERVEALAGSVDAATLTSREAVTELGVRTVETVAREMHPEIENPVWNFTVPEALALIERVSGRLGPLVADSVPLGDRLTVRQMLAIYEWRGVADWAGRTYDAWRIVRLLNPVTAATQEIRERLSKAMYEGLRQELQQRVASTFVREVGRAAIDLYSGRLLALERSPRGGEAPATDASGPGAVSRPLSLLVVGRVGAGKSSLVNALAAEVRAPADAVPQAHGFTRHPVQREGLSPVELVDSPGIASPDDFDAIAEHAAASDGLIWVVAADRPDRDLDKRALEGIRAWFRDRPERRPPPMLIVASGVDRLRPFQDWSPPYDVAAPANAKARNIRSALDAIAEDLSVPLDDIVPACLSPERGIYNADLVWARLAAAMPEAQSSQLLRRIAEARSGLDWRRVLAQAASAGRLAIGALTARGDHKS